MPRGVELGGLPRRGVSHALGAELAVLPLRGALLKEKFKLIRANDDATVLDALSLSTPKIRLLRSLTVEKKNSVQA
ncbi:uncharacterized protein LOC123426972 isoform X2 [Hordeum vulgare subsp. vulgare]|uniref:uncharacterized protein LOC123426972 isoform X2 n=1 Tax=Hordeum vulgare subsp. vulgare TaxID=112509 RepID=UPI001D1A555E|nr:uncharacterized protein LOC123426972 isoform X2 [Hordeum vulgare subsp. vulgare]